MGNRPDYAWLNSILGIGRVLATIILLETGSIERFDAVGNGKKKGKGNTKNGNKYLAWAFVEAANFALRFCPEAKRFYEHKKFGKK